MPFGLPLRTRNTIVDVYGVLLCGRRFCQSAGSSFAVVGDRVDVVGERQRDDVGVEAVDHGRACLPEPPCDCLIVTFSPVFACQCLANAALKS